MFWSAELRLISSASMAVVTHNYQGADQKSKDRSIKIHCVLCTLFLSDIKEKNTCEELLSLRYSFQRNMKCAQYVVYTDVNCEMDTYLLYNTMSGNHSL